MYRILLSRNNKYYAEKRGRYGWFRIGGFYRYRTSAEDIITNDRQTWAERRCDPLRDRPTIVGYYN